jgi:transcriptional regulator with XRE-family HTH domain
MNTTNRLTPGGESPSSAPMAPPIPQRMTRLRLKIGELAQLSGVAENTIVNLLRANNQPREATIRVIEQALTIEELSLRDYLVSIHGAPQREGA